MSPGDCDGDGADAVECGGNDCDDEDAGRYPTNPEVCDADGVDEDCDPSTFGVTDEDGDTYIDAMCCNGSNCGDDCDDGDININPGATEVCNGADDTCSGAADDGGASLCPGGLCVGGACDFDAWDIVFGTPDDDQAGAVAYDTSGNVYMVASVGEGSLNFGGGERTIGRLREGLAVVMYGPDGTYQWDYFDASLGRVNSLRLAVDPAGTRVYVAGYAQGDLGSGALNGPFLLFLDGDGTYRVDRRFGGASDNKLSDLAANAAGVVAVGAFRLLADFGGGERDLGASQSAVVVQFDRDGGYAWEQVFSASDGFAVASSVAVGGGRLAIGGRHAGGLEMGTTLAQAGAFVASLSATGTPRWAHPIRRSGTTGTQSVNAVAVGTGGQVYAAGEYTGRVDLGTGGTFGSSSGSNGFVLGLTSTGETAWAYSFGDAGGDDASTDLAVSGAGDVVVVGEFSTDADFGRGVRRPVSTSGFLARYAADGVPRRDNTYSSGMTRVRSVAVGPGDSTVICGLFTETSDFGSGTRVSVGATDGFILRTGS